MRPIGPARRVVTPLGHPGVVRLAGRPVAPPFRRRDGVARPRWSSVWNRTEVRGPMTLQLPAVSGPAGCFLTLWDAFGIWPRPTKARVSGVAAKVGSAQETDPHQQPRRLLGRAGSALCHREPAAAAGRSGPPRNLDDRTSCSVRWNGSGRPAARGSERDAESGARRFRLRGLPVKIGGPIVHQPAPPLEQVRPRVRRLDLVVDHRTPA